MTSLPDGKPWRKRALLVAPDPATRRICCDALASANFTVENGLDTGAGAVAAATRDHPDVILLGQQLSDVPASEAVKWFRSNKELASTPIIILAMRVEDEVLADGRTTVLLRPITAARLTQALKDVASTAKR